MLFDSIIEGISRYRDREVKGLGAVNTGFKALIAFEQEKLQQKERWNGFFLQKYTPKKRTKSAKAQRRLVSNAHRKPTKEEYRDYNRARPADSNVTPTAHQNQS